MHARDVVEAHKAYSSKSSTIALALTSLWPCKLVCFLCTLLLLYGTSRVALDSGFENYVPVLGATVDATRRCGIPWRWFERDSGVISKTFTPYCVGFRTCLNIEGSLSIHGQELATNLFVRSVCSGPMHRCRDSASGFPMFLLMSFRDGEYLDSTSAFNQQERVVLTGKIVLVLQQTRRCSGCHKPKL
ncbi:hypothetical protein ARMSODRAFT_741319 [Armillaria solidipes]|uniref:Uncharacterized protein n=1 Tax=Armillaria solidipes TaxID=1076256 RepID=A0A2H3C161_9AGAR|nr:hypothetical protein ARMSODRAFT_741319 [Armillaria solidipes]